MPFVVQVKYFNVNMHWFTDIPPEKRRKNLLQLLEEAYEADPFPDEILKMLEKGTRYSETVVQTECLVRKREQFY